MKAEFILRIDDIEIIEEIDLNSYGYSDYLLKSFEIDQLNYLVNFIYSDWQDSKIQGEYKILK